MINLDLTIVFDLSKVNENEENVSILYIHYSTIVLRCTIR